MARKQTKSSKNTTTSVESLSVVFTHVIWILTAGACLLLAASLISFSPGDPPSHFVSPQNVQTQNWCGTFGALLAYKAYLMLGIGIWVLVAALLAFLAAVASKRKPDQLALRIVGTIIMAVTTSSFFALFAPQAGPFPEGNGGLLAIFVTEQLAPRFGAFGTFIILAMSFGVGATLAIDQIILAIPRRILALGGWLKTVNWPKPVLVGKGLGGIKDKLSVFGSLGKRSKDDEESDSKRKLPLRHAGSKSATSVLGEDGIDEEAGGLGATESFDPEDHKLDADDPDADGDDIEDEATAKPKSKKSEDKDSSVDPDAIREKMKKLKITIASAKPATEMPAPVQDLSGYQFPSLDMLVEPESNFTSEMARIVREQAEVLERALQIYRIDAEVVAIDAGPVITLYEVQLAPGTKVNMINRVASDIARELKAQNIRVVPNTQGKSTVGIEVPNVKKEKVRLKELMALGGQAVFDKMSLPMFLGKDASGNALIADLARIPHILIAGTTGSGKSVCMNSIIMSFLFARRPDELKLVLVDPKMVEMSQFRDIPHLMCPVVTDMNKAAAILEWAVTKMEERYALLAEAGVRDIDSYNNLSWEDKVERFAPENQDEEAQIPKKLPRLVFIIDELADLMITNKEVEGFIVRIAQKARAVGLHLILATQRPQANVVTGLIKSNMPGRVSFKVASGMDSRIVLDAKGAELLLGQGDMLYLSPGTSKLVRAQGTLVDDEEVRTVVRFLKNVATQSFEPQLVQLKAPGQLDDSTERDPMFDDAVRIVCQSRRGSVSLLQRRLAIGYGRASRLIEEMSLAGIIGEYKGSQAREVNVTLEEWDELQAAAAQGGPMGDTEAAPAPRVELDEDGNEIAIEDDPESQLEELAHDESETPTPEEEQLQTLASSDDDDDEEEDELEYEDEDELEEDFDDEEEEYEEDEDLEPDDEELEDVDEYEEDEEYEEEEEDDEEYEYEDEDAEEEEEK